MRQRDAHDRDLVLAWQIERVSIMALQSNGGRRLPSLEKLLNRTGGAGMQSWREMKAAMGAMPGVVTAEPKRTHGHH